MIIKKYNLKIRIWHWLSALVIMGSLITVLINSTLLDKSQSSFVQKELQDAGVMLTTKQARAATHGLEDQIWGIHIYFGYALAGLFLFRLISEFFLVKESKLSTSIKQLLRNYREKKSIFTSHKLGVKLLYAVFYVILLVIVCTGLTMAFEDDLGISNNFAHDIKEVHGFCMYLVLGFIALHIGGVIFAENKEDKGIVSAMINGGVKEL